jgi:hypothetical protein
MSFRFFSSWILSSVIMYSAFYFWHGVFLDDISRITFPKSIFFIFSAITYLVIGFLQYRLFEFRYGIKFIQNHFLRACVVGLFTGLVVFSVTRVTGVGIGQSLTMKHFLFDASWQMVEQLLGGMVIAGCRFIIYEPAYDED